MRYFTPFLIFLVFPFFVQAQYFEVGSLIGASGYKGELSDQRMAFNELGLSMGVFGRYHFNNRLAVRATLAQYKVSGSDANSTNPATRERNLSFRSNIVEFGLQGEFNLMKYNLRDDKTGVPYISTGISFFKFNPQAEIMGTWHDLEPLHTEGIGYKTTAFAIPIGLGVRFNVNHRLNFGLEVGHRFTFTDRLDDVSGNYIDVQEMRKKSNVGAALAYRSPEVTGEFGEDPVGTARGDASNNDQFFYAAVTVSINLTDKYGLDFEEKYEFLKAESEEEIKPLTRAEKYKIAKKKAKKKRRAKIKSIKKKLREAKKNKRELKMPAKKRTEK